MNPARLFLLGTAPVALHAADGSFVHAEPGASRAAHLSWAATAPLGAAVAVRPADRVVERRAGFDVEWGV